MSVVLVGIVLFVFGAIAWLLDLRTRRYRGHIRTNHGRRLPPRSPAHRKKGF